MAKQAELPIEGKEIRFAPGRNGAPLTAFWKVWVQGSEVYATARSRLGSAHISVHASGQVHFRREAKQKIEIARVTGLENSLWFHALEIRFLVSKGALSPVGQWESLKKKPGLLGETPEGFALYANLIVGAPGTPLDAAPAIPGETIWRRRLADNRVAVLVTRLFRLSQENLERIRYYREQNKPTIMHSGEPTTSKYAEMYDVLWSQSVNVINVIPLWEESFRHESELPASGAARSLTH
jgi:hypothetical protein